MVCGAAIKTFIAKIWTLLNGNYFSKVAVMKIVHFKSVIHVFNFLQQRHVKRGRIAKESFLLTFRGKV